MRTHQMTKLIIVINGGAGEGGRGFAIAIVINIARMIHGSITNHIFINFIELEHYYYIEMPHSPTMVKDGEEQIKVVINLDDPTFDL